MNPIQAVASIIAVVGVLVAMLGIPLVLGRVRPNPLYGVRTRASLASEAEWYRINRIGGRALVVSGVIIVVTGMAGLFLPDSSLDAYSITATFITLLVVVIPCVRLCFLEASKDCDRNA